MQPQKGSLTLGDKLEFIPAHKNGVSFADIVKNFQITDSVILTTVNRSPSLTRSEKKSGTCDHPSLGAKLCILHLLDNGANVSNVCSDFSISKTSLYRSKKKKEKYLSMDKNRV